MESSNAYKSDNDRIRNIGVCLMLLRYPVHTNITKIVREKDSSKVGLMLLCMKN